MFIFILCFCIAVLSFCYLYHILSYHLSYLWSTRDSRQQHDFIVHACNARAMRGALKERRYSQANARKYIHSFKHMSGTQCANGGCLIIGGFASIELYALMLRETVIHTSSISYSNTFCAFDLNDTLCTFTFDTHSDATTLNGELKSAQCHCFRDAGHFERMHQNTR